MRRSPRGEIKVMTELEYLSSKIKEQLELFEKDTVMGSAKDFGDYKYACGIYRGLLITNGFISELARRIEEDDD
jgi:hypothetical protein